VGPVTPVTRRPERKGRACRLLFEIAPGEHERVEAPAREQMGGAYPLDVPLEVSMACGRGWDAAAH